jgi:hypothetical protein
VASGNSKQDVSHNILYVSDRPGPVKIKLPENAYIFLRGINVTICVIC